jgi:hypothetical protein
LSLTGKLVFQALSKDVFRVDGGAGASGSVKVDFDECSGTKMDACIGPMVASGTVVLAGLITEKFTHTFQNTELCLND